MKNLVGKTLNNRFFLRKLVGQGGMADVYEAWDQQRTARLAVKVLRSDLVNNARILSEFTKEIELIQRLDHPTIVRFYEQGSVPPDLFYFVMDFIEGKNLREMIAGRKAPFPLEEISAILNPVCTALHFAHQSGIYHCDIKPANIMVDNTNHVLLTDFGIARLANEATQGGTPPYMAPEQFNHEQVGPYTDVYGLGVVLFELLCKRLPFRGDTSHSFGTTTRQRIGWEIINLPLPPVRQFNPHISAATESVITKALSKNPEDRFADVFSLYNEFERSRNSDRQSPPSMVNAPENIPTTTKPTIIPPNLPPKPLPRPVAPRPQAGPAHKPGHSILPGPSQQPVRSIRPGPHLVCLEGEYQGRSIEIPPEGLTIGRANENRLHLSEGSVSRFQATIRKVRNLYILEDCGSSLGTRVNQRVLRKEKCSLHTKDIIRIGYEQVFQFSL